ncbi:AI-2E family transporter [Hyalangium rubrum]|uniref:AI-2E family transporter n=1 Tax=Hyalangium rubrum TaxID=3103134 RepID=A0ABU5H551_9BACT|nr:AI-2E family transporter [Hyalangium sp. s54d21]MDY7227984.1 AI-2E family transporter [Hyalangium sp. s54d21]
MSAAESKRWSNYVFAGLFILAVVLFSRILLPFVMPVLLGGFLVVLFMPVQDFLCRKLRGRKSLCAAVCTLTVFLLILAPLAAVGWMVGRELLQLAAGLPDVLDRVDLRQQALTFLPNGFGRYVRVDSANTEAERALMSAAAGSASVIRHVLGVGSELVINLFLMLVAMYYFFLDGRRLFAEATRLIPLDKRYIHSFAREFTDVAYAIVYGNTLTALAQGAIGLVGMLLVGVPHAGVWGAAMVIAAMVPVVGTGLVWVPVSIALILSGKSSEGLFLLAWGAIVVGSADNVLRPKLCGSRMALHPLLVFLSMFGGVAVFGMMGMLVGPLIASFFMAMVRIYRRDFLGISTPALVAPPVVEPSVVEPAVAPAPMAASSVET